MLEQDGKLVGIQWKCVQTVVDMFMNEWMNYRQNLLCLIFPHGGQQ